MSHLAAVKILSSNASGFRVGGYGVVWGGADVVGDYFTKDTDFWFDRLTERPMVLYQHGGDEMVKRTVVGQVVARRLDDTGLWVEAQITAARKYADAIRQLVEKGVLGWSSGAVAHLVDRTKSGDRQRITSWPIAEFSLTPTPAEPRTLGVGVLKSLAGLDAGLASLLADGVEDGRVGARQEAPLNVDDLPDSAFAYVEPGERDTAGKTANRAKRHFPHHGPDGAVDPEMLAAAIAEAAASPLAAKALPHLLRERDGAGDADAPEWREGIAPALLMAAHRLRGIADEVAVEQVHRRGLRHDTKQGRVVGAELRLALKGLIGELVALHASAETADRDLDAQAAADARRRRLKLMEIA